MSRLATPIRKNDNVLVITGKNRGAKGRVLKVDPAKNRLVVEGVRLGGVELQRSQLEDLMQSLSRSRDENLVVDIESALQLAQQQRGPEHVAIARDGDVVSHARDGTGLGGRPGGLQPPGPEPVAHGRGCRGAVRGTGRSVAGGLLDEHRARGVVDDLHGHAAQGGEVARHVKLGTG